MLTCSYCFPLCSVDVPVEGIQRVLAFRQHKERDPPEEDRLDGDTLCFRACVTKLRLKMDETLVGPTLGMTPTWDRLMDLYQPTLTEVQRWQILRLPKSHRSALARAEYHHLCAVITDMRKQARIHFGWAATVGDWKPADRMIHENRGELHHVDSGLGLPTPPPAVPCTEGEWNVWLRRRPSFTACARFFYWITSHHVPMEILQCTTRIPARWFAEFCNVDEDMGELFSRWLQNEPRDRPSVDSTPRFDSINFCISHKIYMLYANLTKGLEHVVMGSRRGYRRILGFAWLSVLPTASNFKNRSVTLAATHYGDLFDADPRRPRCDSKRSVFTR